MLKAGCVLLAVFIAAAAIAAITGKMVSECAGCMKDWEG